MYGKKDVDNARGFLKKYFDSGNPSDTIIRSGHKETRIIFQNKRVSQSVAIALGKPYHHKDGSLLVPKGKNPNNYSDETMLEVGRVLFKEKNAFDFQ